jgi:hypothetical protein
MNVSLSPLAPVTALSITMLFIQKFLFKTFY